MTSYAPLQQQLKDWNLQHDNQCFLTIQNFTESLMNKANEIYHSFQDTEYNINTYSSVINNNFSKFQNISNIKFTENRLEESKFDDFSQPKPKEEIQQPEPDSVIKQRFKTAVENALYGCNLEQYIDQSDANEENLSSTGSSDERLSQFSSLNTAKGNNFPAIIGSQNFMNDPFIGIKIEEIVPQIQVDTVVQQQTIVPGNVQMVQSNLPGAPQINITQQSNIPQPPSISMQSNIPQPPQINMQSNIPKPPQINMQSNIPQAPQMSQQSNIPNPPQMSQQQIPQPPKLPTLPQQSNIVQSSAAPPPPPLNLIPKPPVLPSLPKPVPKPPQQQQQKQEKQKPAMKSELSIQDAFQQKLREMQEKKKKSQVE